MQWIKLLEARAGKAIGSVYEEEDGAATMLIEFKKAEKAEKPEEANAIDDDVAKSVDALVDAAVEQFDKKFTAKVASRTKANADKRHAAIITTHDNELDDPTDGFKGIGEFANTVRKAFSAGGIADERLLRRLKATGASEGVNADGGYTVPVQYATTVFDDIMGQDSLMQRCFLIPMMSNSIKLPAINYTTEGSFGVKAYWTGEGGTITTSKPAFRQPQLNLNKLAALVPVTSELLEDGIAVEPIITKLAAEAITFALNDAILNGDGAGKPTGIIGHASVASVAKESGQGNTTILAANILKMRSRLHVASGANPIWIVNRDTEPQLLQIKDDGGRWLYFAPGTFAQSPTNGRLLGAEVVPSMNAQTTGVVGDIIYANMQRYALGYKSQGVNQAMSLHLYFSTDELAYRWTFRVDGRPWRDAPLTAKNGTATYGDFVTLAGRP